MSYVLLQGRASCLAAPVLHHQLGAERREKIGLTDHCPYRYPWRLMPSLLMMVMLGCSWAKAHRSAVTGVYMCSNLFCKEGMST